MTLSVVTLDPLAEDSHDTLGTLNHVVMNPLVVLPDLFIRVRSVVARLAAKLQGGVVVLSFMVLSQWLHAPVTPQLWPLTQFHLLACFSQTTVKTRILFQLLDNS